MLVKPYHYLKGLALFSTGSDENSYPHFQNLQEFALSGGSSFYHFDPKQPL